VFDTNILIASVLSKRGSPYQCLQLAKFTNIQSVTCPEILDEFREKLQFKFRYSLERVESEVEAIACYSDPDDNMVLECAVIGQANYIVTGDKKHLLPLNNYQGIKIINAADFLTIINPDYNLKNRVFLRLMTSETRFLGLEFSFNEQIEA
jgi:predicted nucleic acid-binding protein